MSLAKGHRWIGTTVPGFVSSLAVLILLSIIVVSISCSFHLGKQRMAVVQVTTGRVHAVTASVGLLARIWESAKFTGAIQQIGEAGVAQATLAIAVHTFIIIFFRTGAQALRISIFVVMAIWFYVLLFPILGATLVNQYITPTPFWCWISEKEDGARLAGEYLWLWIAAITSFALYLPLYLQLRGYIYTSPLGDKWYQIRIKTNFFKNRTQKLPESISALPSRDAYVMLLYPATYFFLVLPDSIIRWMTFNHIDVPAGATFFATCVFGLSGVANVCLLWYTRPGLLLLDGMRSYRSKLGPNTSQAPIVTTQVQTMGSRINGATSPITAV